MKDPVFATAQELAASIRRRELSASEVVGAHLEHIARHNPLLNAIVTLDGDGARRRASDADRAIGRGEVWGPLHGVPITIKDSLKTAGIRTTSGSPRLADYMPREDATVVARLKGAGAIVLGKTNLPTYGTDTQTLNPLFGRTNNPWDRARTPGGSTGGGAAAVAAGLAPLEIGSDWGGSLRCPAHFCGVYTIKPSDRRVPWTGHIPPEPGAPWDLRHLAAIGPIARSVDDLVLAMRVIGGPDGCDWEVPPVPFEEPEEVLVRTLRLAWADDFGVPVTADTKVAMRRLASELEELGCRVEQRMPDGFDIQRAWELWGEIRQIGVGSSMSAQAEVADAVTRGASADSEVPWLRARARVLNATARQHAASLRARDDLTTALERFFDTWDALLCPVASGPAFPHCPTGTPIAVDAQMVPYWVAAGAYCMPFNATGHPAVVLPLARSSEGLPIGLQIVGRRWSDARLLALAARLAMVIGPFTRPPGY